MLKKLISFAVIACLVPMAGTTEGLDWAQFQAAVKAECNAFGDSLGASAASGAEGLKKSHTAAFPSRARFLPYVCVWLKYDVDAQGKPDDIEVAFKSPRDADEGFEEAAIRAVDKWKYEAPAGGTRSGVYTMITFEVAPPQ